MAQELKLKITGLYTDPNPLSEVPEGALEIADNIVLDRDSVAETRRGYKQYGDAFDSNIAEPAHKLFNFRGTLLAHHASNIAYDADDDGDWTDLNVALDVPLANLRMQSIQANNNLYLTTNAGVQKFDAPDAEPKRAGVVRGQDILTSNAGTGTAVLDNSQVAYRIVFGYRDANNNLLLGAPSPRAVYINPSGDGDVNVNINFTVPREIQDDTNFFYQVYRSQPSVDDQTPPDDELQFVAEVPISSGTDLTFTDTIPFELLGAALYTNSFQEGILQANDRPPYANDIETFNNHTFYFNTKQPERIVASFLALPPVNATVSIDGVAYTAAASENFGANEFKTFSSGTLEDDIPNTIMSLARCVNRDDANVFITYLGGTSFLIERDDFGDAYNASCSNAAVFGTTYESDNEEALNRIYISKSQRPEAVPSSNNFDCARKDLPILRGIALNRDMIIILKEGDGIFRITGNDLTNFFLEPHDTTYKIVGPECASKLSNHVFCTSTQGVLAISTAGVTVMSKPIEKDILQIIQLSSFSQYAWGCGYDSDRKYILGVPAADSSSNVEFLYVYNITTASWTTYQVAWSHAIVNEANDRLYSIRIDDNQVLQERKALDLSDYADDEFGVNIVSSNGAAVVVDDANSAAVGMTLVQENQRALVLAINTSSNIITTNADSATWTANAATLYTPIKTKLRWTKESAGNPGLIKLWSEITFMFDNAQFRTITVRFSSNFLSGFKPTVLRAKSLARWGRFLWGRVGWGTGLGGFQPLRTYFPKEANRALWSNIEVELEEAFTTFGLAGASFIVEPTSTRFK